MEQIGDQARNAPPLQGSFACPGTRHPIWGTGNDYPSAVFVLAAEASVISGKAFTCDGHPKHACLLGQRWCVPGSRWEAEGRGWPGAETVEAMQGSGRMLPEEMESMHGVGSEE
ncbi:MAG: hypothetical protein M1822_001509 [Bathelium mastoideum]|nr:MAG: hypothetical protein M1822_001509 [Bathelium mastoideum]